VKGTFRVTKVETNSATVEWMGEGQRKYNDDTLQLNHDSIAYLTASVPSGRVDTEKLFLFSFYALFEEGDTIQVCSLQMDTSKISRFHMARDRFNCIVYLLRGTIKLSNGTYTFTTKPLHNAPPVNFVVERTQYTDPAHILHQMVEGQSIQVWVRTHSNAGENIIDSITPHRDENEMRVALMDLRWWQTSTP
jgi:hypothetical protein